MSTSPTPFADPAEPILRGVPGITDDERADLWDAFHSKSADELAQHLQPLAIPEEHKNRLYQAKQMSMPAPAPLDKATQAIKAVATIDPKVLDMAETHPNVLKVLSAAATTEPKQPAGSQTPSSGNNAGKQPAGGKKGQSSALNQPPRPDGAPHFPPIPENHHRVLASNGGVYDVPAENVDQAREIDPNLHILNP
jgi:hypothetical protein